MADFNKFYKISFNSLSFGPKIKFLESFESLQVGVSKPAPYACYQYSNLCRLPQHVPLAMSGSQKVCSASPTYMVYAL